MFTGISGLTANGEAISVLGNNIANVNTIGFKQGRMLFSDVLSTSINNGQVGRGVQIQAAENIFSQGSFESTDSDTDLAIEGDSFFVLSNDGQRVYSRAGAFHFNVDDVLVNPDDYHVLGYGVDPTTGQSNGVLGDIDLTTFSSVAPKATTDLTLVANLDSAATQIPAATVFDPDDPSTYSSSSSMTVYDSLGSPLVATHYYRKTANANEWEVYQRIGTGAPDGPSTLVFDANGLLSTIDGAAVPPTTLSLNGYTVNIDGTTQFSNPTLVSSQTQNGYSAGTKVRTTIDEQGYVRITYSNGQLQSVAQVALALFQSPLGLDKAGSTNFVETIASGPPNIVVASTPGVGSIFSNSLEQSNVDLATQFVKLIQAQRAFSANSKTITTADEMTQEVLNLKR